MREEISKLEAVARRLEPDAEVRSRLQSQVAAYAEAYLESIDDAPARDARPDGGIGLYDSPISETGIDIQEALALLHENVDTVGLNPPSGRYLGYIPGGGVYPAALGDYLAAVTNRYAGVYYANPGAVRMENMLLRWMAGVMGYPEDAAGHLSSGGSMANLTAIVTARDAHGIVGDVIPRAVVYMTEHAHHSIKKALHIAGVDQAIHRTVPVDDRYRMDAAALDAAIASDRKAGLRPWLIIAAAGTTNTGSVDPLADIRQIATAHNVWFHVDGAYGAFFALCPEGREVLRGMGESDSIIMDPHKTLFLPYGTGAVLVRNRRDLFASYDVEADYMQDARSANEEVSPADISPELSRHFRGLRLWLPLKLAGVRPFRAALSEKIQLARYFHREIQRIDGFEAGPTPDLSVVIYRYRPSRGDADEFNRRLIQRIQDEGRIFVSSTRIDGHFSLRLAISCFRTHLDDIDETLEVLARTAREMMG
jgi:glutamate/tyrosine decarboxylase-like PLP-dependent enzyme